MVVTTTIGQQQQQQHDRTQQTLLILINNPQGRSLLLALNGLIRFAIGMVGLLSNSFLVVVVARNKPLRTSSTGVLLAALGACEAVVGASSVVTLFYGIQDNYRIDLMLCFWALAPATFAFIQSPVLMFLMAVDRLLGVLFPFWFNELNAAGGSKLRRYLGALLASSLVASGVVFALEAVAVVNGYQSGGDLLTFKCSVDDLSTNRGPENTVMFYTVCATLACYVFILGLVLARKLHQQRQILVSLTTIVGVMVVCWTITLTFRTYLMMVLFPVPTLGTFTALCVTGALTAVSQSLNTFVLYGCSTLYRQHLAAEWKNFVRRLLGPSSASAAGASVVAAVGGVGGGRGGGAPARPPAAVSIASISPGGNFRGHHQQRSRR